MHKILFVPLLMFTFISGLFAQDFFDEMKIVDISNAADVKTSIVRSKDQALLIVKTQIPGIRIESNNVIIRRKQVENGVWHIFLKPGTHRIVFQAEGFISVKQRISFNPKAVKGRQLNVIPVDADADKNSGKLVLSSNPPQAAVYINGDFYGYTPYLGKLVPGNYKLELKIESYLPFEETIIILPGATYPLNVEIKPQTLVEITSKPDKATLYLDGEKIDNAPVTIEGVHLGKHTLKAVLAGHVDAEKEFEIKTALDKLKIEIPLFEKVSSLSINGSPSGAQVVINNKNAGVLPLIDKKLSFGKYILEIKKGGYLPFNKSIVINDVKPYRETIHLQPKSRNSALLYSAILPGAGQYYLDQEIKGYILGSAVLGCAAAALIFNSKYADEEKAYFNNREVYEANVELSQMAPLFKKITTSYDKMESTANSAKVFGLLAAVIWAYNIADIFIFSPPQQTLAIDMKTDSGVANVSLTINF